MSWLIHQHENVYGIAIVSEGRRDETEIERERHAVWQKSGQPEQVRFRIISKFITAAFWCFDDCVAEEPCGVEIVRKSRQVVHRAKVSASGVKTFRATRGIPG